MEGEKEGEKEGGREGGRLGERLTGDKKRVLLCVRDCDFCIYVTFIFCINLHTPSEYYHRRYG